MRIKIISISILITLSFLILPNFAKAQVDRQAPDIQVLIETLQQKIEELRKRIVELQEEVRKLTEQVKEVKKTITFSQNLYKGIKSEEVKYLQEFLSKYPDIYPEGLITGYFGSLTEKAVKRFQEKHADDVLKPWGLTKSTGFVGETTRAKLNGLISVSGGPAIPARPAVPAQPAIPSSGGGEGAVPATPATPAEPAEPTQPAEPAEPATPATPPSEGGGGGGGATPAIPATPATPPEPTPIPEPDADTTPPVISNIQASCAYTDDVSATRVYVTWSTNEESDTSVIYALVPFDSLDNEPITLEGDEDVLSHTVTIEPLPFSTTYYYKVTSTDSAGNTAESEEQTFITREPPEDITPPIILDIQLSDLTQTSVRITWTTDEENAHTVVEYGLTTSYGNTATGGYYYIASDTALLDGLTSGTTYHYRIVSSDTHNNTAYSEDRTFTTLAGGIVNTKAVPIYDCTSRFRGHNVLDSKVYAVGGRCVTTPGTRADSGIMEEYNPISDSWSSRASFLTTHSGGTVEAVNGKLYAIGGAKDGWQSLDTVEEYDPSTDSWIAKTSISTRRRDHASAVVNGKIYVISGVVDSDYTTSVEMYDPVSDTWTAKALIPAGSQYFNAEVLNGKIYVFGGNKPAYSQTLYEYDPSVDSWTTKASPPISVGLFASAVVNDNLWVFKKLGGTKVLRYDPVDNSWDTFTYSLLHDTSTHNPVGVVNGKIYIVGSATNITQEFIP